MLRKWTEKEKAYLAKITPGHSHKEILALMNKKFDEFELAQIKSAIQRYDLNTGRTGRFEKGQVSLTKGMKFPPGSRSGCEKTYFKKGRPGDDNSRPVLPVGTERLRHGHKHRGAKPYWWIKTEQPNVWRMKHVVVWENACGPVPKGYMVTFLDSDTLNCKLENLTLITLAENARLNQMHLRSEDPDLTQSGILVAKLKTQIGRKENG